MKKYTYILIGIIVVIGIILVSKQAIPAKAPVLMDSNNATTTDTSTLSTTTNKTSSSTNTAILPTTPKASSKAWITFQKYLEFAKKHDLEGIKSLSHQISATCKDATLQKQCFDLMDNVYNIGITFKENDYVNVWEDSKQIILSNNIVKFDDAQIIQYSQIFIFFTKDSNGNPKLLGFDPYRIVFVSKKDFDTATADQKLSAELKDSDKDGLVDNFETCEGATAKQNCVKTDPTKRDSNGNGWWDGIENLFYKN